MFSVLLTIFGGHISNLPFWHYFFLLSQYHHSHNCMKSSSVNINIHDCDKDSNYSFTCDYLPCCGRRTSNNRKTSTPSITHKLVRTVETQTDGANVLSIPQNREAKHIRPSIFHHYSFDSTCLAI